jgi:hypothetical protein
VRTPSGRKVATADAKEARAVIEVEAALPPGVQRCSGGACQQSEQCARFAQRADTSLAQEVSARGCFYFIDMRGIALAMVAWAAPNSP